MPNFDWNEFKAAIGLLKAGVDLPFRDVIFAATGRKILPFDRHSTEVVSRIDKWISAHLQDLSAHIRTKYRGRSNELGNAVEEWLRPRVDGIPDIACTRPLTERGHAQASGYPDCLVKAGGVVMYFDVKVYQASTRDTTFRSFYYQPTNQNKLLHDGQHFLVGFESKSLSGNNQSPFEIIGYEIIDIYELPVQFKAEFNANNIAIYSQPSLRRGR